MERGLRLAFVGKPNSGQTSAAVYLKRSHGFKRVRMMQGVTRICKMLYWYRKYERPSWEKQRDIYDALYQVDNSIWITYVKNRLEKTTEPVVIDDAKFLNEVRQLRELGFIIIRVNTSLKNRVRSVSRFLGKKDVIPGTVAVTEYFSNDPTTVMTVDYSIYHDGKLANLYKTIDELLINLKESKNSPIIE